MGLVSQFPLALSCAAPIVLKARIVFLLAARESLGALCDKRYDIYAIIFCCFSFFMTGFLKQPIEPSE